MKRGWQKYLLYASVVIVGGFILFETIRLKNTGFEGKSLWDWMELLIIPLVLALGAFYLNRSERNTEREIATDRQQEAALQSYFDHMTELLLKENLRATKKKEVRDVARTRTLTVLRTLDGMRKGLVLQFLHEAKLIKRPEPLVDLSGADLQKAILWGADLKSSVLRGTNLSDAVMDFARLQNADLQSAQLQNVSLFFANLSNANLIDTYLSEAILLSADFSNAKLERAEVTREQLTTANSLKGATMPDGTKHE